ncbi:hypothetical protein CBS147343_9639 [Aspergillus niger]|nr:hypothetical protein CBS147371_7017 [Aspergillus niger]KAI2938088.1 hypothetical protein CBS147322_10609 [Aspergillus niger]KAI2969613.1 hypothetical protein CBS147324_5930 [Aspergillus niger]KAI2992557.1 hypothetical protein CBS147344_866 [Aspergillus niger]KAI3060255.1 hypothetical protein CBS147343_9639 [Aspergillus niger]
MDFPTRPPPSQESLQRYYIGKDISSVPKPAVVLDVAIIKRHCASMLDAVKALDVGFRAHVKTHKTPQVARLQAGEDKSIPANFVISTLLEGETLLPLFKDLRESGRKVNVLYGIPLVPSQVPRLAALARELGEGSISVMIDHPDQVQYLTEFRQLAGHAAAVFLKVDSGYHRAGLPPSMLNKGGLIEKVIEGEREGTLVLLGVYSHNSLSYGGDTPEEVMGFLMQEITGCREALRKNKDSFALPGGKGRELVVSVGATPQVVVVKKLLEEEGQLNEEARRLKNLLHEKDVDGELSIKVELHAGVYPVLDMQQLGTNIHPAGDAEKEVGISVVAEVCSVYNDAERSKPEALVAAGSLALGREPCKSYPGWGVVGDWRREKGSSRLIVDRISQEHAIVAWEVGDGPAIPLKVGQTVRIYPNHACVTGAMYGWYLVVDSSRDGDGSTIVDVWPRPTGW